MQCLDDSFVIVSDSEVSEYQSTTLGIYDKADYMWVSGHKTVELTLLSDLMVIQYMYREGVSGLFTRALLNGGTPMET